MMPLQEPHPWGQVAGMAGLALAPQANQSRDRSKPGAAVWTGVI